MCLEVSQFLGIAYNPNPTPSFRGPGGKSENWDWAFIWPVNCLGACYVSDSTEVNLPLSHPYYTINVLCSIFQHYFLNTRLKSHYDWVVNCIIQSNHFSFPEEFSQDEPVVVHLFMWKCHRLLRPLRHKMAVTLSWLVALGYVSVNEKQLKKILMKALWLVSKATQTKQISLWNRAYLEQWDNNTNWLQVHTAMPFCSSNVGLDSGVSGF